MLYKFSIKYFVVLHFGFPPVRYTFKGGGVQANIFLEGTQFPLQYSFS
jgi:hypothetical protein